MPTKRNYGGEQQNYVPKGNEVGGIIRECSTTAQVTMP